MDDMGADGKMLGRTGYRGCCLDCDGPRDGGVPRGERNLARGTEKTGLRREVAADIELAGWVPDGAWDEPLADLMALTDRLPDGYTEPPPGWTGPVYEVSPCPS